MNPRSALCLPTLFLIYINTPYGEALRCVECPYTPNPPYSTECNNHCDGDVCFIVVNAYFNGTLSAGCINLNESDKEEFTTKRKDCNREPHRNRTVCACNTGDGCNSPKTPIADYDFVADGILEGYDLTAIKARMDVTTKAEPTFELSTDRSVSFAVVRNRGGENSGGSLLSTAVDEDDEEKTEATLPPLSLTPTPTTSTKRPPSGPFRPNDDEEGLIEVKSSVLIKPLPNHHVVHPAGPRLIPVSTTTDMPSEELSAVYRARILPTDDPNEVEEDNDDSNIVMVKTAEFQVKETSTEEPTTTTTTPSTTTSTATVPTTTSTTTRTTTTTTIPTTATERAVVIDERMTSEEGGNLVVLQHKKSIGQGSIEEVEVSTGVEIGSSTGSSSTRGSSARPLQSSRQSIESANSSITFTIDPLSSILAFLLILLM